MAGRRGLCVLLLLSALLAAAAPTGERARGPRAVGRAGGLSWRPLRGARSCAVLPGVRRLPALRVTGCGSRS